MPANQLSGRDTGFQDLQDHPAFMRQCFFILCGFLLLDDLLEACVGFRVWLDTQPVSYSMQGLLFRPAK